MLQGEGIMSLLTTNPFLLGGNKSLCSLWVHSALIWYISNTEKQEQWKTFSSPK